MHTSLLLSAPSVKLLLQIAEKKSEAERELRKRERLEKEARDLKAQVEAKNTEVTTCYSTHTAFSKIRLQAAAV